MAKNVDHHEIEELIPAYVLGSLEPEEIIHVLEHLEGCPDCREICDKYREVIDTLPTALNPESPPPALKESLLSVLESGDREKTRIPGPKKVQAWPSRLRIAFAALGIVLIVGLATSNLLLWNQLNGQREEQSLLTAKLDKQWDMLIFMVSPKVKTVDLVGTQAANLAQGKFFFDPYTSTAVLVASELPPPPPGQVYQLWLISDGVRTNGGLFRVDSAGRSYLFVQAPQNLGSYQVLGVTNEPAGGSPGPTGTKVLGGNL